MNARFWFLLVAATALVPGSAQAEDERELARNGDWKLTKVFDPFADKAAQCQIRSISKRPGARRERPLIIFDITSRQISVRPALTLQGAVEANRALKGSSGDSGRRQQVVINHGIRIDDAPLQTIEVVSDGQTSLEAHFDNNVFEALAADAGDGETLYYLWSLASSRQAYEYPLAGLRELLPTAREECGKPTSS